jgi:ABC-2 type transport system ATP-binding protein
MLAIETFDLSKQFSTPAILRRLMRRDLPIVHAVEAVTIRVESGQIFGLLGPNGAGKTTLIKLLCTLITPSRGTARVNGFDLARQPAQIRASVGLITSDERSFYGRLSGRENLLFFAALHGLSSRAARNRVQALLEQVELTDAADRAFQTYSSGMRQRLAIARGMLHDPAILFLDEPTRGLDPHATNKLHAFITDEIVGRQHKTVWLTTQRLDEAEKLCHRVAILDRGKIRAEGTIGELRALFAQAVHYTIIAQTDGGEQQVELDTKPGSDELARTIEQIIARGGKVRDVQRTEASLESIFTRILTGVPHA